jgi:hypothetical protein
MCVLVTLHEGQQTRALKLMTSHSCPSLVAAVSSRTARAAVGQARNRPMIPPRGSYLSSLMQILLLPPKICRSCLLPKMTMVALEDGDGGVREAAQSFWTATPVSAPSGKSRTLKNVPFAFFLIQYWNLVLFSNIWRRGAYLFFWVLVVPSLDAAAAERWSEERQSVV